MNLSKKFEILTLEGQNRSILAKIGPKLGQKGQNRIKWPRESIKVTFPHGFRP